MEPTSTKSGPLFYAVPVLYLVALLLLPVPWMEIEVGHWVHAAIQDSAGRVHGDASGPLKSPTISRDLTGWQLAYERFAIPFSEREDSPIAAQWSWEQTLGPPMLLAGLVLGLWLPPSKSRVAAITTCSVFAFIFCQLFEMRQAFTSYVDVHYLPGGMVAMVAILTPILIVVAEWARQAKETSATASK